MPPAWPPANEQRPSHFPEAGGWVDSKEQEQPHLSAGAPPLSGRELLVASRKFSDLHCTGCHPEAACPRPLTPWRQEPAPTLTSNNPQTQQQETLLKINMRPRVSAGGSGDQGGWEDGCWVYRTVSRPSAASLAQETLSRGLVAKGSLGQGGVRSGNVSLRGQKRDAIKQVRWALRPHDPLTG